FNDRYGMGRIYVHEGKDEFIFGSEAKSLLRLRPAFRAIDPEGFAQYLRFNCITSEKTLFPGISLMPPAASWHFSNSVTPKKQCYFEYGEWEKLPSLADDDFYSRFSETASRVFPTYAQGSGKVALSLTAGLDTRAIMASLRAHNAALPCYTFGGPWGELFDIRTARRIASMSNQPFEAIRANGTFLKEFG